MTANQIIWHQLDNESPDERIARLNELLHRIFFDGKACNEMRPDSWFEPTHDIICRICGARAETSQDLKHSTPRFLESLDTMQLIVESGKFAEVREEYYHWLPDAKQKHECRVINYRNGMNAWYANRGNSRQEAFYLAALTIMGYEVVQESQGGQSNV